jgi:hypothetical protein
MTWDNMGRSTTISLSTYWETGSDGTRHLYEGVSHRSVSDSGDLSEKTPAGVNNTSWKFYYSFDIGGVHDVHGYHARCRRPF